MKNLYQSIKEEEEFELNKIKDYYKQGFVPMTLVDNADESDIETFVERRRENLLKLKPSKNENLFENEIILNQYFSSILSDKGELQVGDSIYRYTEKGLLITHISSRELLDDSLTYKTSANSKVKLYIPNKKRIPDFRVYPIDEGCEEPLEANEFSMADESYGCGRGGSRTIIPAPDTSNYNVCVDSKSGWIDNIFGKSYVCEYKFNSSFKLRTIFEASDFYFFQDVYAQAKFKQKKWFGWFSNRDAEEVYLLNKKVALKTKGRRFKVKAIINGKTLEKVYGKIAKLLTSKPKAKVAYVSNVYDLVAKVVETYKPTENEIELAIKQNSDWIATQNVEKKPFLEANFDLKNFFGKKIDKAIIINVLGKNVFKMSNAELIKLAYKSLRGKDVDLKKGQTGGVVILGQDPTSSNEVKPIFYSIFGEKIKVNRLAVAKRNFKTLSRMKLNELYFIFELDSSGSSTEFSKKYGFSIDLS